MKTGNRSEPNTGHDLRQSFSDIKGHLDVLVETVGNLSALVLRMNSSSGSTISRLRSNLNETKNDLIRLQNELTELNKSVHTDIAPFIISAVNDVRKELDMLRKSTTANVSGLWKHWNRTDAEIEDIIKMIAQQNETLHFKIAYHSDVLYSEVKDIEKKQSRFHNYTNRNMKNIRSEMNQTRQSLQHTFNTEIARVNTSWHKALEDIDGSLRLSVTKVKVKVDRIKQDLQNSMNNIIKEQNEIKDDFSKTKAGFQENDRKHDSAISNQASEMKSMKKRIETLEGKLDSKTRKIENDIQNVQKSVNNMKNSANRVLGSYVPFILVLYYFI
jgi:vacuolar-type H+-ATPase subunit I/STV1